MRYYSTITYPSFLQKIYFLPNHETKVGIEFNDIRRFTQKLKRTNPLYFETLLSDHQYILSPQFAKLKNDVIQENDLIPLRPQKEDGFKVSEISEVIGKRLKHNIFKGDYLKKGNVSCLSTFS